MMAAMATTMAMEWTIIIITTAMTTKIKMIQESTWAGPVYVKLHPMNGGNSDQSNMCPWAWPICVNLKESNMTWA